MNVLEKILEEIENINYHPEGMGCGIEDCGITDRYEACEYGWDEAIGAVIETINNMDIDKDINVPSKDGWIDRKNLKEEIDSLRFTITGMRSGKTTTIQALEEYRKSILRIIDEQPTYMDDGWIPVEDGLPEEDDSKRYIITDEHGFLHSEMEYGNPVNNGSKACFYKWDDECWDCYKPKVIAWQPLPEPYRQKEKNNE